MADNYLENQYAQYEARKAAWEKERKLGVIKKQSAPSKQSNSKSEEKPLTQALSDDILCTSDGDFNKEVSLRNVPVFL